VSNAILASLLTHDWNRRYANGLLEVSNVSTSRKVIHSLLEKYRAAGGSVIHVVHDTPAGAPLFTPGTDLAAIFDELSPRDNEPVSYFFSHLASLFRRR
jgi:hypothetical protein